jgi:hypothetical protein
MRCLGGHDKRWARGSRVVAAGIVGTGIWALLCKRKQVILHTNCQQCYFSYFPIQTKKNMYKSHNKQELTNNYIITIIITS